jgi:hypothetical protein
LTPWDSPWKPTWSIKPASFPCFSSIYLSGKHFNIPGASGSGLYFLRFNFLAMQGSIHTREDLSLCQTTAFFEVSRWKTVRPCTNDQGSEEKTVYHWTSPSNFLHTFLEQTHLSSDRKNYRRICSCIHVCTSRISRHSVSLRRICHDYLNH